MSFFMTLFALSRRFQTFSIYYLILFLLSLQEQLKNRLQTKVKIKQSETKGINRFEKSHVQIQSAIAYHLAQ